MGVYIYNKTTKTRTRVAGRWDDPDLRYLTANDIDALMQGTSARQWSYLAELINDAAVSRTHLWSSDKITLQLTVTLDAAKEYTDQQIAKFKTASYAMAESTSEMIDSSVLYLLPVSGANYYDIYALVDDTPTAIGTTQIQLTDYYTKTEADNLFLRKDSFETADIDFGNDW